MKFINSIAYLIMLFLSKLISKVECYFEAIYFLIYRFLLGLYYEMGCFVTFSKFLFCLTNREFFSVSSVCCLFSRFYFVCFIAFILFRFRFVWSNIFCFFCLLCFVLFGLFCLFVLLNFSSLK